MRQNKENLQHSPSWHRNPPFKMPKPIAEGTPHLSKIPFLHIFDIWFGSFSPARGQRIVGNGILFLSSQTCKRPTVRAIATNGNGNIAQILNASIVTQTNKVLFNGDSCDGLALFQANMFQWSLHSRLSQKRETNIIHNMSCEKPLQQYNPTRTLKYKQTTHTRTCLELSFPFSRGTLLVTATISRGEVPHVPVWAISFASITSVSPYWRDFQYSTAFSQFSTEGWVFPFASIQMWFHQERLGDVCRGVGRIGGFVGVPPSATSLLGVASRFNVMGDSRLSSPVPPSLPEGVDAIQ